MQMRFRDFTFPVNPAALSVELLGLLRENVTPFGETAVERVGAYKKRVTGKGYFTGENAMQTYLALEALFGVDGTLFLPGRRPFEAVLNELTLEGVQEKDVVGYSFTFVETASRAAGLSGRTYLAKGGESLWDYAYFANVPIDVLQAANRHIVCIGALEAGEEVRIP